MYISIIIPCHNEEKRITATVNRISSYMEKEFKDYEIIIVENGSTDNTRRILQDLTQTIPFLRTINEVKAGKGRAVRRGMLDSTADYKLFTDADNSTDIHHLKQLLQCAESGCDVVISSRRVSGATIQKYQPFHRTLLGNIFATLVHTIIPLGLRDTQNGFKLFSKKSADAIFSRQTISGWAFDIETLALARKFGFSITELPIVWTNDDLSKMNLKGMLGMLFDLFRIRWRLSTKYYVE